MIVRLLSLVLLLIMALAPVTIFQFLLRPDFQLIVATIVVAVLVLYDVYSGFIIGLGVAILYFRLYGMGVTYLGGDDDEAARKKGPMANLVTAYITPKHLESAQSNVVEDVDTEIIGIRGVYGEPVYGAQGLDKTMPGLEKNLAITGDHWSM